MDGEFLDQLRLPPHRHDEVALTPQTSYLRSVIREEYFDDTDVKTLSLLQANAHQGKIFGRDVPRLQLVFSRRDRNYKFGGAPPTQRGFPPVIEKLARAVEFDNATLCVVNFYLNNTNSIDWHTDAEKNLDSRRIVSVSFGETRRFELRRIEDRREKYTFNLSNRDVFEMLGNFQQEFEHRVPKEKVGKVSTRINVTFRWEPPLTEAEQQPRKRRKLLP